MKIAHSVKQDLVANNLANSIGALEYDINKANGGATVADRFNVGAGVPAARRLEIHNDQKAAANDNLRGDLNILAIVQGKTANSLTFGM